MGIRIARWLAVGLAALVVAGAFAGTVYAGRLSVNEQRWTASGTSEFEDGEGTERIRCPITMSGSFFARTFSKVRETALSNITTEAVNEAACTGEGEVIIEREITPSTFSYDSFTGTLPDITEVRSRLQDRPIYRNRYFWNPFRFCEYQYRLGDPAWTTWRRTLFGPRWFIQLWLHRIAGPERCRMWLFRTEQIPWSRASGGELIISLI
jgi:hypothetical protein